MLLTNEGGGRQQSFTQAAPKEVKPETWWGCAQGDESCPSARWWRREVFVRRRLRKPHRRYGVFWVQADAHAHTLFEYPLGKPSKDKFLKERMYVYFASTTFKFAVFGISSLRYRKIAVKTPDVRKEYVGSCMEMFSATYLAEGRQTGIPKRLYFILRRRIVFMTPHRSSEYIVRLTPVLFSLKRGVYEYIRSGFIKGTFPNLSSECDRWSSNARHCSYLHAVICGVLRLISGALIADLLKNTAKSGGWLTSPLNWRVLLIVLLLRYC